MIGFGGWPNFNGLCGYRRYKLKFREVTTFPPVIHRTHPGLEHRETWATRLNQGRTAIYHNYLPGAESFLHQEQIGLRYVMSLADSANRETLAHAFE